MLAVYLGPMHVNTETFMMIGKITRRWVSNVRRRISYCHFSSCSVQCHFCVRTILLWINKWMKKRKSVNGQMN